MTANLNETIITPPGDLVRAFLETKSKENTRLAYRNDLSRFFGVAEDMAWGRIESVTYEDVNAWIVDMERAGLSPSTIERRVAALSAFYNWRFIPAHAGSTRCASCSR